MIRSTFQASCAGSLTKIGSRLIVRRTRRPTLVLGAALPAQFEDQHAWIEPGRRREYQVRSGVSVASALRQ